MAESFVQLPADSTGKKLRTRQRTIGANTVQEQSVFVGSWPTFTYWTTYQAPAANKVYLDVFNAVGSGVVVRIPKLFIQSTQAAVTGVPNQFDLDRTTTVGTGGTTLTGRPSDTADTLSASVTARHAPTGGAAKSFTLFSVTISSEETTAGNGQAWGINVMPEGNEVREIVLHEGEGLRLIDVTSTTTGSWGVLAAITVEA